MYLQAVPNRIVRIDQDGSVINYWDPNLEEFQENPPVFFIAAEELKAHFLAWSARTGTVYPGTERIGLSTIKGIEIIVNSDFDVIAPVVTTTTTAMHKNTATIAIRTGREPQLAATDIVEVAIERFHYTRFGNDTSWQNTWMNFDVTTLRLRSEGGDVTYIAVPRHKEQELVIFGCDVSDCLLLGLMNDAKLFQLQEYTGMAKHRDDAVHMAFENFPCREETRLLFQRLLKYRGRGDGYVHGVKMADFADWHRENFDSELFDAVDFAISSRPENS